MLHVQKSWKVHWIENLLKLVTCTHLCFKWRNPSKAFKRRNLNILKDYLDKIVFMNFEQNSLLEDAKF